MIDKHAKKKPARFFDVCSRGEKIFHPRNRLLSLCIRSYRDVQQPGTVHKHTYRWRDLERERALPFEPESRYTVSNMNISVGLFTYSFCRYSPDKALDSIENATFSFLFLFLLSSTSFRPSRICNQQQQQYQGRKIVNSSYNIVNSSSDSELELRRKNRVIARISL